MSTYIVGAVVAMALFFALRHIYRNVRDGKSDCCSGGGGCSCHEGTCRAPKK